MRYIRNYVYNVYYISCPVLNLIWRVLSIHCTCTFTCLCVMSSRTDPQCSLPSSGFTYSVASLPSPAPACCGTYLGPEPVFPLVAPSAGVMLCAFPVLTPSASADELAAVRSHTAPLPVSPSQPSFLSTCVFVCWGMIICIMLKL